VTFVGTGGPTNSAPNALALSNSNLLEHLPAGATVGTFSSIDPDSGSTFTYSLVPGTGGDDNASFSISGSTLLSAASFDYATKNSFSIRVRTADQYGLYYEQPFAIALTALPLLGGTLEEGQLVLRWPLSSAGFQLEYTTNLQNGVWAPVAGTPSTDEQHYIWTNAYNDAEGFYRLSLP